MTRKTGRAFGLGLGSWARVASRLLSSKTGRAFGPGPFPVSTNFRTSEIWSSVCAGCCLTVPSVAQGDRLSVPPPCAGRSPPISVGLTPLIGLRVVSRFPSASSRWITSAAIDPIRRNTINQSLRFLVTTKKYVATSETEILEKSAKNTSEKMSASAQMMLRDYAGRRWPAMNHKGRITRLSRLLQWGHRRVRAIYNNESGGRLRAEEMAAIEALRGEARSEYRTIEALAAGLEALLTQTDEDCYRAQIDALRQIYRGVDRPGDQVK